MSLPFDRSALRRIVPFVAFVLLLALRGMLPADGALGVDPRWLYGLTLLVVGGLLAWWWRDYRELVPAAWPAPREVAAAALVGTAVFGLWIALDAPWMVLGAPAAPFVPLDAQGRLEWPLVAVRWIGAALVVPLMHELFWRSFLMRWLHNPHFLALPPQRTGLRAIVLATAGFVLVHHLWLAAAIAGLAYAALYVRSGKLWTAVIAHAVTNTLLGAWVVTTASWAFW